MNNNDLANNSQYVTKCFVCGGGDSSRGSGVKVMVKCFTSGNEHQYQLHWRLGGPPLCWSGLLRNRKNLLFRLGFKTQIIQPTA